MQLREFWRRPSHWAWWLSPIFLGSLYFFCLPKTIQIGDSIEFLLAAKLKALPHPPGFPLWVLLLRGAEALAPAERGVEAASALTALLAIGAICLLAASSRHRLLTALLLPLTLGTSFAFWRYSLLPDVFALHLFFAASYLTLYELAEREGIERWGNWLSVLGGIGAFHHPSFVFLLSFHAQALWRQRPARILSQAAVGVLAGTISYSLIFLLDRGSLWSWGEVSDPASALRHLLRFDYGSLQLSAQGGRGAFGRLALYFAKTSLQELGPPLLLLALSVALAPKAAWRAGRSYLPFFVLYLFCFFPLMNVAPEGYGREVVDRFFLLPELALCFLVARVWRETPSFRADPLLFLLLVFPAVSFSLYRQANQFSANHVTEEFARNVLDQVRLDSGGQPALLFTKSDTSYFALAYTLASPASHYPNIHVVSPQLLFHAWYQRKLNARSGLDLGHMQAALSERQYSFAEDLLLPNRNHFRFYMEQSQLAAAPLRFIYLPAAIRIEVGKGAAIGEGAFQPFVSSKPPLTAPEGFDSYKALFATYANYSTALGFRALRERHAREAAEHFRSVLREAGFIIPAWRGLCEAMPSTECESELRQALREEYDYLGESVF